MRWYGIITNDCMNVQIIIIEQYEKYSTSELGLISTASDSSTNLLFVLYGNYLEAKKAKEDMSLTGLSVDGVQ